MKETLSIFSLLLSYLFLAGATKYEPNWKSLDSRPLPEVKSMAVLKVLSHLCPPTYFPTDISAFNWGNKFPIKIAKLSIGRP